MTRGELLQPDHPAAGTRRPRPNPPRPSTPPHPAPPHPAPPEEEAALSPTGSLLVAAVEGCNVAVAHCVRRGGRHTDPGLLGRLVDGIELGQTAADLEERGSPLLAAQLEVCAAAFGRAAEVCARFPEDPVLAWCGQTCSNVAALLAA